MVEVLRNRTKTGPCRRFPVIHCPGRKSVRVQERKIERNPFSRIKILKYLTSKQDDTLIARSTLLCVNTAPVVKLRLGLKRNPESMSYVKNNHYFLTIYKFKNLV